MENLSCSLEVKSLSDEGTFEGYGAIFNNVDFGGDKVAPGAFAQSLADHRRKGTKVKMLWQHDQSQPIGVWDDLAEDGKGLWGKGRLVMDVARAREAHSLMKAGALDGLSIGYEVVEKSLDANIRILSKVNLHEVSPVTFPMNERARLGNVKSDAFIDAEILEKLKAGDRLTEREFEKMVKGLGLTNSQAERTARVHLKGQGEPVAAADSLDFLSALLKNSK